MAKTIVEKMKVLLGIVKHTFESVKTDNDVELFYDGELAVDTLVYDAEGNAIADGEYVVDGKTYVIAEGKVVEVKEEETMEEETETTEEVVEETMEEEVVEETMEEEVVEEEPKVDVKALEDRVAQLETAMDDVYELIQTLSAKNLETEEKADAVMEFSKQTNPLAQPIQFAKTEKDNKPMTKAEMFLASIK